MSEKPKLNAGDSFPSLTLRIAAGGQLTIPDELESPLAIVLFYRGHW